MQTYSFSHVVLCWFTQTGSTSIIIIGPGLVTLIHGTIGVIFAIEGFYGVSTYDLPTIKRVCCMQALTPSASLLHPPSFPVSVHVVSRLLSTNKVRTVSVSFLFDSSCSNCFFVVPSQYCGWCPKVGLPLLPRAFDRQRLSLLFASLVAAVYFLVMSTALARRTGMHAHRVSTFS